MARLGTNVYLVGSREQGNNGNSYLVGFNEGFVIIDSGGISDPLNVARNVLEVVSRKDLKYLILTSCIPDAAAGAKFLAETLGVKLLIHELDASWVRKGNCMGIEYPPVSPFMVLRGNIEKIGDLLILRTGTPTKGSIMTIKGDYLFSGSSRISILDTKRIKYVFGLYEYSRSNKHGF
ncbi:MBL fold metallo-hydrolase [Metallosphaera tengchongensis]|uniref:MBL fold metallo-hydrolase n=1 Tax=Metallosphaera tengchongensis TaxID=1532350 RepID=UPI001FECAB87|nr:MBL fold metallo-hydrolase [Metallosphaera tengchongensis]